MRALASKTRNLLRDERAVTSIEYAFVGALIAVVCVVTVNAFGSKVGALYTDVCNKVTKAISGAPAC